MRLPLLLARIAPFVCLAVMSLPALSANEPQPLYLDASQPVEKRVDDLVSRMSLSEKVGQMMNSAPPIPRLGVPQYDWWNECLHGVARAGTATVFPQATGMAATWDTELMHLVGDIVSTEARAKHHEAVRNGNRNSGSGLTFWSPNINLYRDPRWGRGQECYGEDPYLTGKLGVAFIKGLQGDDPFYFKVIATPKHFAVHSGPEALRHTFNAIAPERDFYESYLPHFEMAIREGGAYSVMGAYNRTYGDPCCASKLLLTDLLRNTWGFKGYVVSDCTAINDFFEYHKVADSPQSAAALGIKMGCDLECGDIYRCAADAVKAGLLSESDIDICLKRLMTARFRLGVFDPPSKDPYASIPFSKNDCPEHQAVALKMSRESIVLLKNDGILPLKKNLKSILVVGPNADFVPMLLGNYNGTPTHPVTILQGIKDKVGPDCKVTYMRGCDYYNPSSLIPVSGKYLTSDGKPGLKGEYFSNKDLSGKPVFTRQDKEIAFDWNINGPLPELPNEGYSVRWTGEIVSPVSGECAIGVRGDDGYRLSLDGKVVVDDWRDHSLNTKSCKIKFEAGKPVPIMIEYYQGALQAEVTLLWDTEIVTNVQNPDAIVFVGGLYSELEGEGSDRTQIELPQAQTDYMQTLCKTGKPVILVNCSGGAMALPWESKNLPAIIQAWYPGQAGGTAVADVLFGDYNPAGRLPVTFYESTKDLPSFEDYSMTNRTYRYFTGHPKWAFGHGLSYTKFNYSALKLDKTTVTENDTVLATCNVTNVGAMDGEEVVQVYVSDSFSPQPRPIQSLRGFKRINVKRGETVKVAIPVKVADMRYWDVAQKKYVVYPGKYEVKVGTSSSDIRLKTGLTVR